MNPSQKPHNEPPQSVIEELKRLFEIYIDGPEGCRERTYRLLEQFPNNLTLIEIAAACDSLVGKHSEAIAGYQKCLEIAPKTLAYTNNQAWNFIQLKDYEIALTLLSEVKDKWNHPAIFSNWATVLQNYVQNHNALEETLKKRDEFARKFTQYKRGDNNELINTFFLKNDDNYTGETEDFRKQVFEIVEVLRGIERAPVSFENLRESLQFIEEKINFRKVQEEKCGFVIDSEFKIAMAGLDLLQNKILKNYEKEYAEELEKYVFKSIEFINMYLFSEKIDDKFDYKAFEETKLLPTDFQLIEIGEYMKEKVQNFEKIEEIPIEIKPEVIKPEPVQVPVIAIPEVENQDNKKIENNHKEILVPKPSQIADEEKSIKDVKELANKEGEKHKIPEKINEEKSDIEKVGQQIQEEEVNKKKEEKKIEIKDTEVRIQSNNVEDKIENEEIEGEGYEFYNRIEKIEEFEKEKSEHLIEKLRIEGENEGNPLFVIMHFRQKMKNFFTVFIDNRRINQEVRNQPYLLNLERLGSEKERVQVKRYYFILAILLKFYNFYGTHNYVYQQKGVKSHLNCYQYIQLITPVLNHIFIDEVDFPHYQVGNIIQKIHSIIVNYINETRKNGDFLRNFKKVLKRIHEIVESCEKPVENLLESLLGEKNAEFSSILLSNELVNVDGSTKYHEYYIERINKDYHGNEDENWLIFNISILLITFLEDTDEDHSLEKKFFNCYYSSRVTQPLRNLILKKLYNVNNQIPLIEKVSIGFKNMLTNILP